MNHKCSGENKFPNCLPLLGSSQASSLAHKE